MANQLLYSTFILVISVIILIQYLYKGCMCHNKINNIEKLTMNESLDDMSKVYNNTTYDVFTEDEQISGDNLNLQNYSTSGITSDSISNLKTRVNYPTDIGLADWGWGTKHEFMGNIPVKYKNIGRAEYGYDLWNAIMTTPGNGNYGNVISNPVNAAAFVANNINSQGDMDSNFTAMSRWMRGIMRRDMQRERNLTMMDVNRDFIDINNTNYDRIVYGRGNKLEEMKANPAMNVYSFESSQQAVQEEMRNKKIKLSNAISSIEDRVVQMNSQLTNMTNEKNLSQQAYTAEKEALRASIQDTMNELSVEKNRLMNDEFSAVDDEYKASMEVLSDEIAVLQSGNFDLKSSLASIDNPTNSSNPRFMYGIIGEKQNNIVNINTDNNSLLSDMKDVINLRNTGAAILSADIVTHSDKLARYNIANTRLIEESSKIAKFIPGVDSITSLMELRTQKSIEDDSAAVNASNQQPIINTTNVTGMTATTADSYDLL
jgi:phage host-nuclease inhibitor protein Gam